MSEHDQNSARNRNRRNNTSALPRLILVLSVLLLLGGAVLFFRPGSKSDLDSEPVAASSPAEQKTITTRSVPRRPPEIIPESPGDLPTADRSPRPATPVENFEPGMTIPTEPEQITRLCSQAANRLHGFFQHIDRQDYINRFQLQEPSQAYFTALAYRLLDNPPVVSRESDDLYTILRNMAHFFRIIGKDNIILLKTILDRERDKIEDVAAELYFWSTSGTCADERFSFAPSLEKMYEYAGFFLNTMGGRSYLFRRDSRSRLLVNYYSILLVDRANTMGVNRHGIDIGLIIPQLMREIESSNQLIYKENYLDRLADLQEKYPPAETAE